MPVAQSGPRVPKASREESSVSTVAWLIIFLVGAFAVFVEGSASVETQVYILMSAIVVLIGAFIIPRVVKKEPSISARYLAVALAVFLLGCLLRYVIIQLYYHGASDSKGYYSFGLEIAPSLRSLDFSQLIPPFTDTNAMNYAAGFLYTFLPPSEVSGFVFMTGLSFVGAWHFYRAFSLSYPEGNRKLYGLLIFMMPSIWYWTTSLGKDSAVFFGLGIATYGFALLFRRFSFKGVAYVAAGLAICLIIRAPIAAALSVAGGAAYVLRPTRARTAHATALSYIVFIPLFVTAAYFIVNAAKHSVGGNASEFTVTEVVTYAGTTENPEASGSSYSVPNPFTPSGFLMSLVTANFRPFPFEAGSALVALQSLEEVALMGLFIVKLPSIWRAVVRWRRNAMTILVAMSVVFLSVELSALGNFGLLARQRTQLLPFLAMLPCMVLKSRRAKAPRPELGLPVAAWDSVSQPSLSPSGP